MERLGVLLPAIEIQHPYPTERFDAKHPRQEPCARVAPARVCAGGAGLTGIPTATRRLSSRRWTRWKARPQARMPAPLSLGTAAN